LRPPPEVVEIDPCGDADYKAASLAELEKPTDSEVSSEFVKINNQFVIPVVKDTKVTSLVVMSLNVEVEQGNREVVYEQEPKLRDEFLQVMFNHANHGGFEGVFTQANRLETLRIALREVAIGVLGEVVHDVLVTNIVRQDV